MGGSDPSMAGLAGSRTHQNLLKAFAREAEANRRYLWFAEKADVDGFPQIAALFRAVAEGETGHAHGHLEYLALVGDPATGDPIGETDENLRSAIASETWESAEMYPGFAAVARDEGFDEIAEWMESLARAEQGQAERLARGLEQLG